MREYLGRSMAWCGTWLAAAAIVVPALPAAAGVVTLKSGLQYEGRLGKIASLGENPLTTAAQPGEVKITKIVLIDDDLRRTYVSSNMVQSLAESPPEAVERVKIAQPVAGSGRRIAAVGPIMGITPFDEWGRRIFSMNTSQGRVDVVQGITEVTPTYCKVEALAAGSFTFQWDMRIATSSVPRDVLRSIILRQGDANDPDHRLRIVRLFIQAERYHDARAELELALQQFPQLGELQTQIVTLRQIGARRVIDEIKLRRAAGQYALAHRLLSEFPARGVASETLLQVRELLAEFEQTAARGKQALERLDALLAQVDDSVLRQRAAPVRDEIAAELGWNTLDRLADFLRLLDDPNMGPDQKVALALSGWLLGSGGGQENLVVVLSLVDVRNKVRAYLRASHKAERDRLLAEMQSLEGATPANVARLLQAMKPPLDPPAAPGGDSPSTGQFTLTTPGLTGEGDIEFVVQLPPEYDPYRRYPCLVTLCGAGTTPEMQLDWWCGPRDEASGQRVGQATRHGYIVIAPNWTRPHQKQYEYSAREHAAVLHSLRDALRRFAIDSDRVYLSGHSMGGDAAWDIALAHPDLWAGCLPIVATADKYVTRYWENARDTVPFYFVGGELDSNRMATNGPEFDRYLQKVGYDVTIVEYQGRGHEHYQDEIQRIFTWLPAQRRQFNLRQFTMMTMRDWDNFFYFVELDRLPRRSVVAPVLWPPDRAVRPAPVDARVLENNSVLVSSSAERVIVYLTPEMVDFSQRVTVTINRRPRSGDISPSLEVMLEDVRTRGDRLRPFWAKVDSDEPRR